MPQTSIYKMSAEERQREYDKVGLPSYKVAEWEAEVRRVAMQEKVVDQAVRHGMPNIVGSEGDRMQFSDPSGIKRTFTPGGDQTSLTIPSHLVESDLSQRQREGLKSLHRVRHGVATGTLDIANYKEQYSAKDQKVIEKLYQSRSSAATDAELTPEERQRFMDKIDAEVSKVPKLSPMMKEPTAQEKFDASMIKLPNGEMGYVDKSGNPKAFEWSKQAQEREKIEREAEEKEFNAILKDNPEMDHDVAYRRMKHTRALFKGEVPEVTDKVGPHMTTVWRDEVDDFDMWTKGGYGKKSKKGMSKVRSDFITRMTRDYGYSAEQAGHSFMMLWSEAARDPDNDYHKYVPEFGEQEQRELRQVVTGRMQEGDPRLRKQRGPGTVTVDGRTMSTEDIDIMPGEAKVTVDGQTMRVINGHALMRYRGEEYMMPLEDVEEAKKEGYELVQ